MVVSIINWGVTPVALGVGSGTESMKVGVGGIVAYQELSCQGDLASQKSCGPIETTCKVGYHCVKIPFASDLMPLRLKGGNIMSMEDGPQ